LKWKIALRADVHVLFELLVVDKLFAVLAFCPYIAWYVAVFFGDFYDRIFGLFRE
jgi:hypothetical protein